jgi:hypothetical protein
MNSYRLLITILAVLSSFSLKSVRSQEAVESKPDRITEEPTIETAPVPQEQPAEEKRAESSSQTTAEETTAPKKKTKKKASPEQSGKVLQDSMTAQEFKAAGLEKLSAEELANLNAWLQGYRQATETKAAEKATAETTKKVTEEVTAQAHQRLNRVESRVDGRVPHLTGHSMIKLEDGTVWRQANAEDRYSSPAIDHPKAVVTRGVFGWKMRISGLPEFYVDLLNQ